MPLQTCHERLEGCQMLLRIDPNSFHVDGEQFSLPQRCVARKHTTAFLVSSRVKQAEGFAVLEWLWTIRFDKSVG